MACEQDKTSETLPPTKIVVAAVIFNQEKDAVLVGLRAKDDANFPLEWEFIGGKVEPGEEYNTAIVRELMEELKIEVTPVKVLAVLPNFAGNKQFQIHFIGCNPVGEIVLDGNLVAHEKVEWVKLEELSKLNFIGCDGEFAQGLVAGKYVF